MAWYRAGGGGVPSSLKSDMNDVLNKKFGTSQDYPPTDWAPTVNLMGPLPEKTVSGAIVAFPDGADTVPLKKCEITLPASLDGYSAVNVKQTGANLFDGLYEEGTYNQTTGQKESSATLNRNATPIRVAPSTQFCRYKADTSYYAMRVFYYDANMSFISSEVNGNVDNLVFTTPANCYYLNFAYQKLGDISKVSINAPYTVTGYHEYSGTTHTASLGRTIYGGTADIVSGEGVSGYGKVDLGTLTWTKRNTTSGHWRFTTQDVPVIINDDSLHVPDMDCVYTSISPTQSWNGITGVTCNTGISQLMICDETYETASDFTSAVSGVYLAYPLATPETFTFDPISIDSKLGNNTLWSEQGNTEVTYRADINLALGGQ